MFSIAPHPASCKGRALEELWKSSSLRFLHWGTLANQRLWHPKQNGIRLTGTAATSQDDKEQRSEWPNMSLSQLAEFLWVVPVPRMLGLIPTRTVQLSTGSRRRVTWARGALRDLPAEPWQKPLRESCSGSRRLLVLWQGFVFSQNPNNTYKKPQNSLTGTKPLHEQYACTVSIPFWHKDILSPQNWRNWRGHHFCKPRRISFLPRVQVLGEEIPMNSPQRPLCWQKWWSGTVRFSVV